MIWVSRVNHIFVVLVEIILSFFEKPWFNQKADG